MKDLLLFGREKWSCFFWSAHKFWWRPFFFSRSSDFGWKNRSIIGEDLFFWRSRNFDRNTASVWFKADENLGQVCLLLFTASKKAPPFAKSWLRNWPRPQFTVTKYVVNMPFCNTLELHQFIFFICNLIFLLIFICNLTLRENQLFSLKARGLNQAVFVQKKFTFGSLFLAKSWLHVL